METLVSAVVLIVIALATLAAVDRAQSTSAVGKGRSVAASLAEQDQERLRALPAPSLSSYRINHGSTRQLTVGGLTYNVASTVDWVRDATGGTPSCSSDDNQADYLKITSTVTGTAVRPVTISSLVAPPLAFSDSKGSLAVRITDDANQPLVGLPISITGPTNASDTTNAAGCAVFAFIPAGAYTVKYSWAGYVDKSGDPTPQLSATVGAGKLNQISSTYDRAGKVTMRFDTTDANGVVISSLGWTGAGMHDNVPAKIRSYRVNDPGVPQATITLDNLYPFRSGGYQTFAGECMGSHPDTAIGNSPQTWFTTGGGVADVVIVPPGDDTKTVTVRQPALKLKVKDGSTATAPGVNGATVVLTVNDPTCISTPIRLRGLVTNSNGYIIKSAAPGDSGVPFGKYDVCVSGTANGRVRRYLSSSPINVNSANGQTVSVPDINLGAATGTTTPCPT